MDIETLISQIEISSNDIAGTIFGEITIEILATFFVIILILYFGSLALSFMKNI